MNVKSAIFRELENGGLLAMPQNPHQATGPEIPEYIKIGQHIYSVVQFNKPVDGFEDPENNGVNIGYSSPGSLRLYINTACPPSVQQVTLWHEVKHAVCNFVGVVEADDEGYITATDDMELMVLRDNPQLVWYLLS
jgi:hypothetical protein